MSRMSDGGRVSRRSLLLGGAGAIVAAAGAGYVAERDNPTLKRLLGGCGSTPPMPKLTGYDITTGSIDSVTMHQPMPWTLAVPNSEHHTLSFGPGPTYPLVVVLPGRNGGSNDLSVGLGVAAFAAAARIKFAFLQPGNSDSSYWHPRADGRDPMAFVTEELIPSVYRTGLHPHVPHGVLGWSMGGFGALLFAQQRPNVFAAAAAMSPAVFPSYDNARGVGSYTFDSQADWEQYGIWAHREQGFSVPVRIDCGDSDPFVSQDRELLTVPGVEGGIESGCHEGGFWRRQLPGALRFLATHLGG
jgi:pimeloyl-ACP methyl ester carboxylesterase